MQGTADGFVRAYKAQIAVEQEFQLIVGQAVTQAAKDKEQLREIVKTIKKQSGQTPSRFWPTGVTVRRRCWRLSNTPLRKVNPSIFVLRSGEKNTASPRSPASEDRDLKVQPAWTTCGAQRDCGNSFGPISESRSNRRDP